MNRTKSVSKKLHHMNKSTLLFLTFFMHSIFDIFQLNKYIIILFYIFNLVLLLGIMNEI